MTAYTLRHSIVIGALLAWSERAGRGPNPAVPADWQRQLALGLWRAPDPTRLIQIDVAGHRMVASRRSGTSAALVSASTLTSHLTVVSSWSGGELWGPIRATSSTSPTSSSRPWLTPSSNPTSCRWPFTRRRCAPSSSCRPSVRSRWLSRPALARCRCRRVRSRCYRLEAAMADGCPIRASIR